MNTVIGRRSRVDLMTPAELAIRAAILTVEEVGAHPLLTDAVSLLAKAQWAVADYVDAPRDAEGRVLWQRPPSDDAAPASVTTENQKDDPS